MKRNSNHLCLKFAIAYMAIVVMASCASDSFEDVSNVNTTPPSSVSSDTTLHSARAFLNATVHTFDQDVQTRANEWQWQDGAVVYLQFHAGSSLVRGYAVYSKSKDSWVLNYNGQLSGNGECEVYFFGDASTSNKRSVAITSIMPVFADKKANYTVDGSEVIIIGSLSPITSRVRFKGQSGLSISVSGLTSITGYNAETNTLATSTNDIKLTVSSTGYTPYVYATFTDATRQLSISNSIDGDDMLFTKTFASNVLQEGKSGAITIPTENTNKGWTMTAPKSILSFSVKGVQFTMIRVASGTFEMGNYNDGNKVPNSHSVTLTKAYYMGQT